MRSRLLLSTLALTLAISIAAPPAAEAQMAVIDLKAIRAEIEAAGFHGPQEVEIFSAEDWWKRPGEEVIATCIERFNTVC